MASLRACFTAITLASLATVALSGQPGDAAISGVIVDAMTRMPVSGALVSLYTPNSSISVLSGAGGAFSFPNLGAGKYDIHARKNGAEGAFGRRWLGGTRSTLPIAAGQRAQVKIALWRPATISGVVRDERGRAVEGVSVRAARLDETGVGSMFAANRMMGANPTRYAWDSQGAGTNDRGEFEIRGLTPGHYVVCVPISHRTTRAADFFTMGTLIPERTGGDMLQFDSEPVPPPTDNAGRPMTYVTTCAPSAAAVASATVINVGLGEDRTSVDIQLRLDRRLRVSGTIVQPLLPDSSKVIDLTLTPVNATAAMDAGPFAQSDGDQFQFLSVPPGQYWLEARRGQRGSCMIERDPQGLWSRQLITVSDSNISGVVVTLQPGFTISGRTICESAPPSDQCGKWPPIFEEAGFSGAVMPSTEGRFVVAGLPPRKYTVKADSESLPPGWRIRTALSGGLDAIGTGLDLRDRDIADLVVTLTREQTAVRGFVRDPFAQSEDAVVVAFPRDTAWWVPRFATPRHMRAASPAPDGRYEIVNLPEGDYWIAAVRGSQLNDFPSREKLGALSTIASQVRVGAGTPSVLDLTVGAR